MSKDVKIDIIYFKNSTDVSLEFGLHGNYPIRLLAASCNNLELFFRAFRKSVLRSEIIITVGGYKESEYLPGFIAKAIAKGIFSPDLANYGIASDKNYLLPAGAVPLASSSGKFGGFLIESGPQAIISLTDDKAVRLNVMKNTIVKYITEHYKVFGGVENTAYPEKSDIVDESVPVNNTEPQTKPGIFPETVPEVIPEGTLPEADIPSEPLAESILKENSLRETLTAEKSSDTFCENISTESIDANTIETAEEDSESAPESKSIDTIAEKYCKSDNTRRILNFNPDELDLEVHKHKKPHPHRRSERIICAVLSLLILIAGTVGVILLTEKKPDMEAPMVVNRNFYGDTAAIYSKLTDNYSEIFDELKQYNDKIGCWLSVGSSNISYPVVSADGNGNSYYLTHSPDGETCLLGSVFTESDVSASVFSGNTVISGGCSENQAFSFIKDYFSLSTFSEKDIIVTTNKYNITEWKVFSALKNSDYSFDYTNDNSSSNEERKMYLENIRNISAVPSGITFIGNEALLLLVGIDGNTEYTLAAVMVSSFHYSLSVDIMEKPAASEIVTIGSGDKREEYNGKDDESQSGYEQIDAPSQNIVLPAPPAPPVSSIASGSEKPKDSEISSSVFSSETPASSAPVSSEIKPESKPEPEPDSSKTTLPSGTVVSKVDTDNGRFNWDTTLTVTYDGKIRSGNAKDIVAMVIEAEMGSSYPIEALKAQAIAAFNWMVKNGAADGRAPEVPMKTAGSRSIEAVNAVMGFVLMYDGNLASPYYYACSAGKTACTQDIWGGSAISYLQSVNCPVDIGVSGYELTTTYSAEEVRKKILNAANVGIDVTGIPKDQWIVPYEYDANGVYCKYVKIGGQSFKATALRYYVFGLWSRTSNPTGLRSTAFTISYNSDSDTFTVVCRGWGHGVGMSQYGAREYALDGWTFDQILAHFFPGTYLIMYY